MRRRQVLAALGGGLSAGVAGCLGGGSGEEFDVGMSVNAFQPAAVTVTVGSSVVWRNTSGRRHTVTAYEDPLPEGATYFATGGYDSEAAARAAWDDDLAGGVDPGETYGHTFRTVGTVPYVCIPHERDGMVGTVEVVEE